MAKAISLKQATDTVRREQKGRLTRVLGFEVREMGPHTVSIIFYSVKYNDESESVHFMEYRADVYVDGKRNAGLSFG